MSIAKKVLTKSTVIQICLKELKLVMSYKDKVPNNIIRKEPIRKAKTKKGR